MTSKKELLRVSNIVYFIVIVRSFLCAMFPDRHIELIEIAIEHYTPVAKLLSKHRKVQERWKDIGRGLNLSEDDITKISNSHSDTKLQIEAILKKARQSQSTPLIFQHLCNVLVAEGCRQEAGMGEVLLLEISYSTAKSPWTFL